MYKWIAWLIIGFVVQTSHTFLINNHLESRNAAYYKQLEDDDEVVNYVRNAQHLRSVAYIVSISVWLGVGGLMLLCDARKLLAGTK